MGCYSGNYTARQCAPEIVFFLRGGWDYGVIHSFGEIMNRIKIKIMAKATPFGGITERGYKNEKKEKRKGRGGLNLNTSPSKLHRTL
jgi:hypothetical protein